MDFEVDRFREKLKNAAPALCAQLFELAEEWADPILRALDNAGRRTALRPKSFSDPVWGAIELTNLEVLLVDSPMLQRLRGVRQLGFGHYVYPGAGHSRLEHVIGVVEGAQRMIEALRRSAYRWNTTKPAEHQIPEPTELDIASTRFGALLHDIGHGPFSHVSEPLIRETWSHEFDRVIDQIRAEFTGATKVSTIDAISALLILSPGMCRVFAHERFEAVKEKGLLAGCIVL